MATITDINDLPSGIVFSDLTFGVTLPGVEELALLTITKVTVKPKWEKHKYEPAALVMGYIPEKQGYEVELEGLGDISAPEGYEMGIPDGSFVEAIRLSHDTTNRNLLPGDLLDPKYGRMFLMVDSLEFQKEPATFKAKAESGCYKAPPSN